jgi:hypothetical protein
VAENTVRIRRRRHQFALMFRMAERAGNRGGIWLVKIMGNVTLLAGPVNRRRRSGMRVQKFIELEKSRLG